MESGSVHKCLRPNMDGLEVANYRAYATRFVSTLAPLTLFLGNHFSDHNFLITGKVHCQYTKREDRSWFRGARSSLTLWSHADSDPEIRRDLRMNLHIWDISRQYYASLHCQKWWRTKGETPTTTRATRRRWELVVKWAVPRVCKVVTLARNHLKASSRHYIPTHGF